MTTMTAPTSLENIEVRRIDGTLETMAKYRGQVLLIVNVASRCAFTKQYADSNRYTKNIASEDWS